MCRSMKDRSTIENKGLQMSRNLQSQILSRARQLLDDRKRWTRHAPARDLSGRKCAPTEVCAVRYCAYGALLRSAYQMTHCKKRAAVLARSTEQMILGGNSRLAHVNDKRGYRVVLRLLDAASDQL